MRMLFAAIAAVCVSTPSEAQINPAAIEGPAKGAVQQANQCLNDFNQKATQKKLSPDIYKLALDGACNEIISVTRGLYSISLSNSSSQSYMLERFDANVREARASMVAAYAMR